MRLIRAITAALLTLACATTSVMCAEDRLGDVLPEGAVQRLGTLRLRYGSVGDVEWLPDGRGLIGLANRVEIWDFAQGKRLESQEIACNGVRRIAPRADGRALLIADARNNVVEWDLVDQKVLHSIATEQPGFSVAHYSPDESRVLTTATRPPSIKEFQLETGEELVSIKGNMHYFHEAIYGPDGKTAFVNGGNGSGPVLSHFDLADGKLLQAWHKDYYAHSQSLLLSPDGQRIFVGSRHSATEWSVDGYEMQSKFTGHHGHAVTSVGYCADPDQLLTGSRDGSIRRWNRLEQKVLLRWWPHEGHVTRIRVSPDSKWVLSYGSGNVAVSSMETGESRVKWERHEGTVQTVAALPDGLVASGATDGTVRVWHARTGESKAVLRAGGYGVYALACSPDGKRIAAGCKDGIVREFSYPEGEGVRELKGHLGFIRALAYTPDGSALLSSAGDGTVRVRPAQGTEAARVFQGHRGGVLGLDVSADGTQLLTGGRDGTVRLWDLASGDQLKLMEGARGWVEAVRFGADGIAFSTGRDARLIKWDIEQGTVLAETPLGGVGKALALSADARTIFVGDTARRIDAFNADTLDLIRRFTGHTAAVSGLALTGDGAVVSSSEDSTLLVWTAAEGG